MKLIRELITEDVKPIQEENEAGGKDYYIQGVFLQGSIKNRNGRVYPTEILQRAVKSYTDNFISRNRAYGELNHPNGPTINLDKVSHMIKELYQSGDNFIGKAKIMDTPNGRIVKSLMDEGCCLGVSSRGLGSLKKVKDANIVQEDFYLATAADIVADPSAPDAFVHGIMENKDWVYVDGQGWIEQFIDNAKITINESSREEREEMKMKVFEAFIRNLH